METLTRALPIFAFFLHITVATVSQPQNIDKRQSSELERSSYCYGDGSICGAAIDLNNKCDAYSGSGLDQTDYYKCICGNGYVATEQECYWCQVAWQLDISWSGATYQEGCSSAGVSIAPVPTQIVKQQSEYNASYTGPPPPGGATPTGAGSASLTQFTDDSFTPTAAATARNGTQSSRSGGSTIVVTYDGGSVPTGAPDGSSPTDAAASATSTGAAGAAVVSVEGTATWLLTLVLGIIAGL